MYTDRIFYNRGDDTYMGVVYQDGIIVFFSEWTYSKASAGRMCDAYLAGRM